MNHRKLREFFCVFLRLFQPRNDVRVNVGSNIMYARTLDRIASLYLRKFSLSESFETDIFKLFLREGMRVIDVGANLGYYTLIAASKVGERGKVFAFEPEPENFSLLLKNISANRYRNIEALNLAVCEKSGKVNLYFCEEHQGGHRIYDFGQERKAVEVKATSLDEFFEAEPAIDLIKIDTEGAEHQVFSGMEKIIRANPKILIITEFWPSALKKSGSSPEDFLKMIRAYNFSIYLINEKLKKLEPIDGQNLLELSGPNPDSFYVNLCLTKNHLKF